MNPPLLALVGPTAVGKSALALALCELMNGELIACDSVQIYRGFDVGSAKPNAEEQKVVRHHLIDVVDWHQHFDAQLYRELATAAIHEIRRRGKTPILCGGTGLYLRALRYGLMPLSKPDPALRRQFYAQEAKEEGSLYRLLRVQDAKSAEKIEPKNLVQVVRALEIIASTGQKASDLRAAHGFAKEEVPMLVAALSWPDDILRKRIHARATAMVANGLLAEIRTLLDQNVAPDCRPMRAVGYREACEVVCGLAAEEGLVERIEAATWSYARRQRTWLRKEKDVHNLAMHATSDPTVAIFALAKKHSLV